jgi:hypothetical protein
MGIKTTRHLFRNTGLYNDIATRQRRTNLMLDLVRSHPYRTNLTRVQQYLLSHFVQTADNTGNDMPEES